MQKRKAGPYLTPYTKINSKWTTGANIKLKAKNLLEDRGEKSSGLRACGQFLDMTPKHDP